MLSFCFMPCELSSKYFSKVVSKVITKSELGHEEGLKLCSSMIHDLYKKKHLILARDTTERAPNSSQESGH